MRKRILATVLAAGMAVSLAACGGGSNGGATEAAKTEAAKTEAAKTEAAKTEETKAEGETKAEAEAPASDWKPSTTISIVVPASAGGTTDLSARVWAQYAKDLGFDAVVVNAGGASGSVAANQVLDAAADGCTVLYGHNLVNVANIAGVTDYNYTAFKLGPTFCLEPAQQLYASAAKYKDWNDFVEQAKANPGKLMACTEVGAYTYYELLGLEVAAGIDLDLVDVGSNSEKIAALLGGQVDLMPGAYGNAKDYVESGDFVCLGVPTADRYETVADLPTMKEQGVDYVYPDCEFSFYFPKDTPDEVIAAYEAVTKQLTENPDVIESLNNLAMVPKYLNAADSEANDAKIFKQLEEIAATVK